jgi:transcriptional regulator with XRE-family HTH domain
MADTDREVRERFAANIERLRRRDGLSVEGLAARSQIDPHELRRILRGDEEADYGTIVLLAGALGVEPGELFEGIAWIRPGRDGGGGFKVDEPDGG